MHKKTIIIQLFFNLSIKYFEGLIFKGTLPVSYGPLTLMNVTQLHDPNLVCWSFVMQPTIPFQLI